MIVLGTSGSGKTRNVVLPELKQAKGSYIVNDIDGLLYQETKEYMASQGYQIRTLNLMDASKSVKYNPLEHVKADEEINALIECLDANTNWDYEDPLFRGAKQGLLQVLIRYAVDYAKPKERTLYGIYKMLCDAITVEGLDEILKQHSDAPYMADYEKFREIPLKTSDSILLSVKVQLQVFAGEVMKEISASTDFDLTSIAEQKTVVYVILPGTMEKESAFVSMFYEQLFRTLEALDTEPKEEIVFLMDEFANCGIIPDFVQHANAICESKIAKILLCLQSMKELDCIYTIGEKEHLLQMARIVDLDK